MTVLSVKVDGEEKIKLQFRRLHNAIADPRPVYEEAANWFQREQKKQFASEGGEYPPKWAALSPGYAARKMAAVGRKPILEYSGDLVRSLTKRPFAVEVITQRAATFGTDVPYAIFHQRGTPFMPARPPLLRANNKSQRGLQRIIQAALAKEWK